MHDQYRVLPEIEWWSVSGIVCSVVISGANAFTNLAVFVAGTTSSFEAANTSVGH